jgi:hypothetical protein
LFCVTTVIKVNRLARCKQKVLNTPSLVSLVTGELILHIKENKKGTPEPAKNICCQQPLRMEQTPDALEMPFFFRK